MKHIAVRAGVHPTTVSMALRNHPDIPEATRNRLKWLAKEMGYVPDPMLSSLNAYRHQLNRGKTVGTLGWLNIYDEPSWPQNLFISEYFAGATKRADELGYHIDRINIQKDSISTDRLQKILQTRGIKGLVIAPLQNPERGKSIPNGLNWDHFCGITIGYSFCCPMVHRVCFDYYGSLIHIIGELSKLGYKRPGLYMEKGRNERVNRLWEAGYYIAMRKEFNTMGLRVGLFEESSEISRQFLRWFEQEKPDAVIAQAGISPLPMLRGAGIRVPEDCGVVHLEDIDPHVSSLDQQDRMTGMTAVNLLVGAIHRHELGLPDSPLITLVSGHLKIRSTTLRHSEALVNGE